MKRLVFALCVFPLWGESVSLVDQGRAASSIALSSNPTEDEQLAARELKHYVLQITGAMLPTSRKTGVQIHIGLTTCPPALRERIAGLRGDGYAVEVQGKDVYLGGKGRHGTSFAVYEFLERFGGVRWLWPGESGDVVPQRKSLAAENVSLVREPAFLWRGLGPGGALWGAADRWQKERELGVSVEHQKVMRDWERHNRFGGLNIYGGHSWGEILPPAKYGPTHPEYYALVNGKRDWENFDGKHRAQFCTSNPEVVKLTVEYCLRMFREHPDYDGVSIGANDGRAFCECDRCQRLDTGESLVDNSDPEARRGKAARVLSDRMVTFGNQVAAGVAKTRPEKIVMMFAYSQAHTPAKRVKGHPNLLMLYTLNTAGLWNEKYKETAFADVAGWAKVLQKKGIYGYHTQGNFPDMFRLIPDLIAMELRKLRTNGYEYYQTQAGNGFAVNGLNFYVLGRLLWDPSIDVSAIIDDYCKSGFGEAAPIVKRYLTRHIDQWKSKRSVSVAMNDFSMTDYQAVLGAYPKQYRQAARRDLDEALRVAQGSARRRVEFLRQGFEYFDRTIEAAEVSFPLVKAGWKPATRDKRLPGVAEALQQWEARERFIEQHKDDFVLSYVWVRYNTLLRHFNPLSRYRGERDPQ